MEKHVIEHFKKIDPILYSYIERIEKIVWNNSENIFFDICDAIISQQLSEKAGATILKRFVHLFPDEQVTPEYLLKIPDETIRAAGTSWAKVRSLKDLAQKVLSKQIDLEHLEQVSNEEVIEELIQVKGIGKWTAEMILIFTLRREDIFSHGDLGLRRAIQKIYKFKKEPSQKQVEKIIKKWSPYKSYACRILWKTLVLKD